MRLTRRYRRYSYSYRSRSRRRTRGQTRRLIQAWALGIAVFLALAALAALLLLEKRPAFGEGDLLVCANGGGSMELYWPEAGGALYELEVRWGENVHAQYYTRPAARLSGLPEDEEITVRVRAAADGRSLFGSPRQVYSGALRAAAVLSAAPEAPKVTASGNTLRWSGEGDVFELFASGPGGTVFAASTEEREAEGGDLSVRAGWRRKGFVLCGPAASPAGAESGPLSLSYEEEDRLCVLKWNGNPCAYFEVQQRRGERWETVARLAPEERAYCPDRLRSGSYNRFRVAAMDDSGQELEAEETAFFASISPLYATVWPIQALTLYEDPGKGDLASVPGGAALCVVAEEGDWFRVRYENEVGWVDSRFCMINLPEYIGDYCSYDITNSYESLFAVHGSPLKQITGQVVKGFEDIRTEEGDFLVPYLYPCAKKLLSAAQSAREDGLRLKIYEAFRPREATRFCYDTAQAQMNDPAVTDSGQRTTLFKLMTDNGRFSLGSFLAKTISAHNRGIALDLTLEKLDTGEELEMQSKIHDLSWYAATDRNNLNAKLLAGYMTGAGMNGLVSEWWHFQDDETRRSIGLNACLDQGVSAERWVQDDAGWTYVS